MANRISQEVVEAILQFPSTVRVSQETVEAVASYPSNIRLSQVVVEVLIPSVFRLPRNSAVNHQNPAVV